MKTLNRLLKKSAIILLAVNSLFSCEYDSNDDNYQHKEKPTEQVQVGIDLAGVNPDEVIYAYKDSYFYYSLHTDGRKILAQKFFLDDRELNVNPQDGYVWLNINAIDDQIHELKLIMGLPTNTGSLAEYVGYEMYVGEFNFKVKFIPRPEHSLNIRTALDESNHLKLVWDKPSDYEIEGYLIYNGEANPDNLLATINDQNQTYFVDKNYVYGHKTYIVIAKIKNSWESYITDYKAVEYDAITNDNFEAERTSLDEFKLKWNNPNPYPCKYVLQYQDDKVAFIEDGNNEAIISNVPFPTWYSQHYTLYLLPIDADITQYEKYPSIYGYFTDRRLPFGLISYSVDVPGKALLGIDFYDLIEYDITDFNERSVRKHNMVLSTGSVIKVSGSGRVAINSQYNTINIYKDKNLTDESYLYYPYGAFYLTDKNTVLIEDMDGFSIYDANTSDIICSKKWERDDSNWTYINSVISANSKYVHITFKQFLPSKQWTEIYEMNDNNEFTLLRTEDNPDLNNVSFSTYNCSELITEYNNSRFKIENLEKGTTVEINGIRPQIDPFNGNLIYRSEGQDIYIKNKDYNKELFKHTDKDMGTEVHVNLYNNTLFSGSYFMNVSKYFKQ